MNHSSYLEVSVHAGTPGLDNSPFTIMWTLFALHQDLELSLYFFLDASSPWK